MDSGSSVRLYVILRVVLIPAAAGALAILAARLAARRASSVPRILTVGAAVGAALAHLGLAGIPPIPPVDTIGWIPFGTLAAFLLLLPAAGRLADFMAVLVVLGATAFLVGKPVWSQGSVPAAALWIGLMAVGGAIAVDGLAWSAERLPPTPMLIAVLLTTVGASISCVASHSALLAMLLGGVAATLGALAFGGLILKVKVGGRGVFGVLVVTAAGVVLYARLYSALPAAATILLCASLFAPIAVAALPRFRGRVVLAPILAAVLAVGAAYIANRAGADKEAGGDSGDDLYYH
jgi:hypothetical protein